MRDILPLLDKFLSEFSSCAHFWVGYSGGTDSHVLLHALSQLIPKEKLYAIHINHGWHPQAEVWSKHCQAICRTLSINYCAKKVNAEQEKGESPEEAARRARYAAFIDLLGEKDCLVTAHHQQDQAETLLLQLLRGTGVKGLAGMPYQRPLGLGVHVRPLLRCEASQLVSYAKQHSLRSLEDPSNTDLRFDRNFLRHSIFPLLQKKWPQISKNLERTAKHCAETSEILEALAQKDLAQLQVKKTYCLDISLLKQLPSARQSNALRYWFKNHNFPFPHQKMLLEMEKTIIQAHVQASPILICGKAHIRRYRNKIYLLGSRPLFSLTTLEWTDLDRPCIIPTLGKFQIIPAIGKGIKKEMLKAVSIRFRQSGERFHPVERSGSHPLKKLMQEWAIPPWERFQVPLLYAEDKLLSVVGYAIAAAAASNDKEPGIIIDFQPFA